MPRKSKANKKREPNNTKTLSTPADNTIINQAILILTNNISSANGNCHRQGGAEDMNTLLIQVLDIGTIINYTPVEHNQCKNSKMSFRFYLSDECSMSIYHAWYYFDPLI